MANCSICKRQLNDPADELSADCGGDCWGCIGAIEASTGYQPSLDAVYDEIARGVRPVSDLAKWQIPAQKPAPSKPDD